MLDGVFADLTAPPNTWIVPPTVFAIGSLAHRRDWSNEFLMVWVRMGVYLFTLHLLIQSPGIGALPASATQILFIIHR
jgi:hypothetical protein